MREGEGFYETHGYKAPYGGALGFLLLLREAGMGGHGCEGVVKRFSLKGSGLEGAEGALDTESKATSLGFRATTQYPVEYSRQDPFSLGPQAPKSQNNEIVPNLQLPSSSKD